jgi:hypothetical protein
MATRAERKAGQMLAESAEQGERAKLGRPGKRSEDATFASAVPTLAQIGVTRDQSSKWQKVAHPDRPPREGAPQARDGPSA